MNRIKPCHKGETGPRVFDLHVGLLYVISYERGISPNDRATLAWQLNHDWPGHVYTGWTENIVSLWQGQFINPPQEWNFPYQQDWPPGTRPTGDVDPRTAKALNWLLEELGAFPGKVRHLLLELTDVGPQEAKRRAARSVGRVGARSSQHRQGQQRGRSAQRKRR